MFTLFEKLKSDTLPILIFAFNSLLLTGFLFFIDEGNYNFDWMLDAFAWVVFTVFTLSLFVGQLSVFVVVPKNLRGFKKLIVPTIFGMSVALFVIFELHRLFS